MFVFKLLIFKIRQIFKSDYLNRSFQTVQYLKIGMSKLSMVTVASMLVLMLIGSCQQGVSLPASSIAPLNSASNGLPAKQENSYQDSSGYNEQIESRSEESSSDADSRSQKPITMPPQTATSASKLTDSILAESLSKADMPLYSVGQEVDGSQHGKDGFKAYELSVGEVLKKYLFFSIRTEDKDDWQNVKMEVKRKSNKEVLTKCVGSAGKDSCFLPASLFAPNEILTLEVECEDTCDFTFSSKWSNLEHLTVNSQTIFHFGDILQQLYHVQLQNEGFFQELRIILKPRATSQMIENLKIYGKYGVDEMPSSKNFDFQSVNLWNDGEGIFLLRKEMPFSQFSLLVSGQAETTYIMTVEKILSGVYEVKNSISTDDFVKKQHSKLYHFASLPSTDEEMSIRFSTMVGQPRLSYFKDAAKTMMYESIQYEFMRDSQVLINKMQAKELTNGLYLSVECPDADCAFIIYAQSRNLTQVQLHEGIYSFLKMGSGGKAAIMNFLEWTEDVKEDSSNNQVKVSVFVMNINGVVAPTFYTCQSDLNSCAEGQSRTEIKVKGVSTIGMRQNYQLELEQLAMTAINKVEKAGVILISFACKPQAGASQCLTAVQYANGNKIIYMREGRPIEDKLISGDVRYYKYVNQNKDVKEIIVNINTISGHIVPQGYMKDSKQVESEVKLSQGNRMVFQSKHLKDILIVMSAEQMAVYSISLHVVRDRNLGSNVMIMSEDVTYNVGIPPQQSAIFQIVPIFNQFFFKYTSSLSLYACILNEQTLKCNKDEGKTKSTEGMLKMNSNEGRHHKVQLFNPFDNLTAQVTSIFHSAYFEHCEMRQMGHAYSEIIADRSCLNFNFQSFEPIEIYLSKRSYIYLGVVLLICGVPQSMPSSRIVIDKPTLTKHCSDKSAKVISMIWTVHTPSKATSPTKVKTHVVVQHLNGPLILPQGISYNIRKVPTGKVLKQFLFEAVNKIKTRVSITEEKGRFRIYAKVISAASKQSAVISNVDYDYEDDCNAGFMCQPTIQIPQTALSKCVDCNVLVAVYGEAADEEEVEGEVQFSQYIQTLDERKSAVRFLEANSQAYYTYHNVMGHQSIVLLLADHNHNCATMYLDKVEYPSAKSYLMKSERGELVYPNANEGKYYVTVLAHKACSYSLSVESSNQPIGELQPAKPAHLKMEAGQIKYFVVAQLRKSAFKILAMPKFGEVQLYSNRSLVIGSTPLTPLNLNSSLFEYVSEHRNVLNLSPKHSAYCSKCHLLVAVKALVKTEAVLQLVYPSTPIPLVVSKVLYDTLSNPGDVSLAYYDQIESTNFLFTVDKGEVQVEVTLRNRKFEKTFSKAAGKQELKVELASEDIQGKTPFKVVMTARATDTTYSLELQSLLTGINQKSAEHLILRTGEPNRVMLGSKKGQCYSGFIRHTSQSFILNTYIPFASYLQGLIVQMKIDAVKVVPELIIMKNVAVLGVNLTENQVGKALEICLQINGSKVDPLTWQTDREKVLPIVFTQNDRVTTIAADVLYPVESKTSFVVASESLFLLDVMQCEGQSKISVASNSAELAVVNARPLSDFAFSKQSHALKIQHYQPTFIHVDGGMTMLRYIPMDLNGDTGLGYMNFDIGQFYYMSKFKEVRLELGGVINVKPTKAKVAYITYTLYLNEDLSQVQAAAKCGLPAIAPSLTMLIANTTVVDKEFHFGYGIQKQTLLQHFNASTNIYMVVVAELVLDAVRGREHYKFIYAHQQLPKEAYITSSFEKMNYAVLAAILSGTATVFLVAMILFIKHALPMLAKLRNNNGLAEEQDQEDPRSMEVPQSSDRNGVIPSALVDGQLSDRLTT